MRLLKARNRERMRARARALRARVRARARTRMRKVEEDILAGHELVQAMKGKQEVDGGARMESVSGRQIEERKSREKVFWAWTLASLGMGASVHAGAHAHHRDS